MFPSRLFAPRYFAARYWARAGAEPTPTVIRYLGESGSVLDNFALGSELAESANGSDLEG